MVVSLRFDRERLAATAADPLALATDLAEALVATGVPFSQAHQRVGQLVVEAERRGCGLDLLVQKDGDRVLPELDSPAALLDPALAVMRRTASFGPAREHVQAQLADLRKRIDQDQVR